MVPEYYSTLEIDTDATQGEIKGAYRRLVKLFHPDSGSQNGSHEKIVRLNAAYEVLGDPQRRQAYDRQMSSTVDRRGRPARERARSREGRSQPTAGKETDALLHLWMQQVYRPVDRLLDSILYSLDEQIELLSADPFDDGLMETFQDYLHACHRSLDRARLHFRSTPNPAPAARAAAHLYYCLDQLGDGISELETFTYNYDEGYLHAGREMFRIAIELHREATLSMQEAI